MIKRKIESRIGGVFLILLLLLTLTSSLYARSFNPVFKWIDRFRDGETVQLKAQVSLDSITFLRSQETDIDSAAFDQLLKSRDSKPSLQFKMISGKEMVLEFEMDEKLCLEKQFEDNRPVGWKKVEFVKIRSYPLNMWPRFLSEAVNHGLMEYKAIEVEGKTYANFTFKRKGASSIKFGKKSFKLSSEFYRYMKIPGDYKPRRGNSDKLVILVHEPHWLRVGQYQLIPGLKALLDSNSNYKFRFLVEGGYEKEEEYIPTKPTLSIFRNDVSRHVQVYTLLKHFIIDGPLAYRLLYDPDLPSVAIDDNEAIAGTPRQPQIKRSKNREILRRVYAKLEKLPGEQSKSALETFTLLFYYSNAVVRDLKGQYLVDYYRSLEKYCTKLSVELKSLEGQDFSKECSDIKNLANDYNTLVEVFEKALIRDGKMAWNINAHFQSKYAKRIPIVFIGNFHTPGIIERLDNDISYVVIEPRISTDLVSPSDSERKKFNDALKPGSRLNYLKNLAGLLKLNVAPTKKELPYCRAILKKEGDRVLQREKEFITSSPLSPETTSRIYNVLKQNGSFSGISVSCIDPLGPPPQKPPIDGPFAAFNFDPDGKNPKFFIYDRDEDNWNRPDRLKYLKMAFIFPLIEEYKKNTRKVDFDQDENSNRVFCKLFDPETQTFYFYEREGLDIYRWLIHPRPGYDGKAREKDKEGEKEVGRGRGEAKRDREKDKRDKRLTTKEEEQSERDRKTAEKGKKELKGKDKRDSKEKLEMKEPFTIHFRISFLRPLLSTGEKVYG